MAKRKNIPVPRQLSDESREFLVDMSRETDRGAALVAAEFLSEALATLLKAHFIDNEVLSQQILRKSALSQFASRVTLAYAVGLLPESIYDDLNIIREIRNLFAHSYKPMLFIDQTVSNMCCQLKIYDVFAPMLNHGDADPRSRFLFSTSVIMNEILVTARNLKHAEPMKEIRVHTGNQKKHE